MKNKSLDQTPEPAVPVDPRPRTGEDLPQGQFLRIVIDSLAHPFYVIDASTYAILLANRALGSNVPVGATCYTLTHHRDRPCDGAEEVCPVEQVKRTRQPTIVEHIHHDANGNIRNVEIHAHPVFDDRGNVVQVIEYTLDITRRKRLEKQTAEHEQFIESLINLIPDILYVYDLVDRKNIYSNEGVQRVLGYSVLEIQAMGDQLISALMHPEDWKEYVQKTVPRYASARDRESIGPRYRMKHKNGEWRWLSSNEVIYRRNTDGSPRQILGMIHDITESVQSEQALRRQADELKARNEELMRFNQVATGRELRMIALKREINELRHLAGQPPRYPLEFDKTEAADSPAVGPGSKGPA